MVYMYLPEVNQIIKKPGMWALLEVLVICKSPNCCILFHLGTYPAQLLIMTIELLPGALP